MSSTQVEKFCEKLVSKLAELFQLNQPDLDFAQSTESRQVHFQLVDISKGEHSK